MCKMMLSNKQKNFKANYLRKRSQKDNPKSRLRSCWHRLLSSKSRHKINSKLSAQIFRLPPLEMQEDWSKMQKGMSKPVTWTLLHISSPLRSNSVKLSKLNPMRMKSQMRRNNKSQMKSYQVWETSLTRKNKWKTVLFSICQKIRLQRLTNVLETMITLNLTMTLSSKQWKLSSLSSSIPTSTTRVSSSNTSRVKWIISMLQVNTIWM